MVNQVDSQRTSITQPMPTHELKTNEYIKKENQHTNEQRQETEKITFAEAEEMTESMNKFLKSADSRLKFVLHDKLETYYVNIIDNETDEVIREIPSEKLMNIRAAMKEFVGLLIDRKI